MQKILFITSTNLAANPRLLKELQLALYKGYVCTVLQFGLGNWCDAATQAIERDFGNFRFVQISALRKPFFPWLTSTLLEQVFSFLPNSLLNSWMLSIAAGKRSLLLWWKVRAFKEQQFDWVVAHNPAAFYPALVAAKRFGAKLGIDVEDYHPGETNLPAAQLRMRILMRRILPQAYYCSYAAPLIKNEVQKDIPDMSNHQLVLLNGFPQAEFSVPEIAEKDVLRLVWFSQHIAAGRGLENVIPVVNKMFPKVELHLVGTLNQEFDQQYLGNKTGINLHGTISQKALHQLLSLYDAGLATDIPVNRNREIALTNKILAYAQAGLVIAAMHTEAQDKFLESSGLYYVQMENNPASIEHALLQLYQDKQNGKIDKIQQHRKGQQFSWESNIPSLIKVWES